MITTNRHTFAETDFRKATASQPDKDCVRVARRDNLVELRDDKTEFGAADDHRLILSAEQFDAFQTAARTGLLDRSQGLSITVRDDGNYSFRAPFHDAPLVFTQAEVIAFLDGVARREFDAPAFA